MNCFAQFYKKKFYMFWAQNLICGIMAWIRCKSDLDSGIVNNIANFICNYWWIHLFHTLEVLHANITFAKTSTRYTWLNPFFWRIQNGGFLTHKTTRFYFLTFTMNWFKIERSITIAFSICLGSKWLLNISWI